MNFIAAVLLYHSGEVAGFWLMCALMEKYKLKDVMSPGLPGLIYHFQIVDDLGKIHLPKLFDHFEKNQVSISLFSTDWIISLFLNFVPIELTGTYLDSFFNNGWSTFYSVAIEILRYYENDLILLKDPGDIIG
jgi:hypothetical protein